MSAQHACPLCDGAAVDDYFHDNRRCYLICRNCALVFVPSEYHLSAKEQRRRYDLHQNSPDDQAYRTFLERLAQPLLQCLPEGSRGLDYGAGPGPTLSLMLQQQGHAMDIYDLHYANDPDVLCRHYDFLSCSETIEHFSAPGQEWRRFLGLVRRGGWIGVMTQMRDTAGVFADWYYKNDPTHIGFYSTTTFRWLADHYGLDVTFHGHSVALFRIP